MIWLIAGLFFITLATLMLEVLDTRLLSVLTWYHLSFLAVSVAMLGMAAGAVLVFVGGDRFRAERAARLLPVVGAAVRHRAAALAHRESVDSVSVGSRPDRAGGACRRSRSATLALTVPFVLSGIVVTLALTRTRAPIGWLYGADLVGAATGCLAIIWLLELTDITSTALATGGARRSARGVSPRYAAAGAGSPGDRAIVLFGAAPAQRHGRTAARA